MSKKASSDPQNVADLLKKLQASYLEDGEQSAAKKKKEQADEDDKKFREKLAVMLGKATEQPSPKKAKKDVAVMTQAEKDADAIMTQEAPTKKPTEIQAEAPQKESEEITVTASADVEAEPPKAPVSPSPTKPKKKKETPKQDKASERKKKAAEEITVGSPTPTEEPPLEKSAEQTVQEAPQPTVPVTEPTEAESTEAEESNSVTETEPSPSPTEVEKAPIEEERPESTVEEEPPQAPLEEVAESPVAEQPRATATTHPLDKVIPLQATEPPAPVKESPTRNVIEKKIEKRDEPKPKSKPVPSAPTTPMPIKATELLHDEEPTSPTRDESRSSTAPIGNGKVSAIRITPNVTRPHNTQAPDFAKTKQGSDPNTIVIRPPVREQTKNETIVIRPKEADKPKPAPQLPRAAVSTEPIKIGKEVKSVPSDKAPSPSETPKPIMKKEPNTTFIPPTEHPPQAPKKKAEPSPEVKAAPATKKGGVSLPRTAQKKQLSAEKSAPPAHKRRRAVNDIPVTTFQSDEDLEEVLDDKLTDDPPPIEEIPVDEPEEMPAQPQKLSIFQRRQQQKQKQAEEKLSAIELICKRSGLNEDDVAMIFELGYENELGRLVGYENLKRLKTEHLKRVSQNNRHHYRIAYGYRGEEFAGAHQRDTIMAAYVYDRKHLLLRLFLTAIISLLLFFIDMPHTVGAGLTDFAAANPLLLPLAGILLLSAVAALSWRQLNAGLRRFLKFAPTPYTVPALLVPITLVYDIASLFGSTEMLRVNFLTSLSVLLMTVCDLLRVCCEMRALELLCADAPKTTLAPAVPRKKKLRQGDKIVKIINDDIGDARYEVRVSEETIGFFRRFNAMDSASRPFTVMLGCTFALALLGAFTDAICTVSLSSSLSTFMTVLLLTAPLSACVGYFYPLYRANRLLAHRNCTLIGEESVEEFNQPKTVIFRDTDLYATQKCTEIAVREGNDFRTDLRLSGILFRKLGGTLETIGQPATAARSDPPVSVLRIQNTGVEAVVDNRYHMLAGSAEFLKKGGIRVPRESTDKALRRTENVALMYVAIDGVLKLSYEIEYRAKPEFENLIRDLADTNSAVAIYSYDPNLSDAFLQKSREENAEPVCAVKPGRFEEDKPLDIVDTGAVALGVRSDIACPLYAATGIGNIRRFGIRMQLISALLGTVAVTVLSILGQSGLFGILSILGYQCFWILVSLFATHSELNREKLHLQ